MSNDKIGADILRKYAYKDTLVDFLNMQGELFRSGALDQKMGQDGAIDYLHELVNQIDNATHLPPIYGATRRSHKISLIQS